MNSNSNSKSQDRICEYLSLANNGIIFDELSREFLAKAGVLDLLENIPVPIILDDDGITTKSIVLGMARVIGGDSGFRYAANYLEYIRRSLGDMAVKVFISEGVKSATEGDYEVACMYLRAALMLEPQSLDALYLYGRALKDAYEIEGSDEAYVGIFKAEALQTFEILTIMHPDFAMGYYFLGYAYLNLGLYTKAKLTWDSFMELMQGKECEGDNLELIKEIGERLRALAAPLEIEQGCNAIMAGSYVKGKELLEKNRDKFEQWWPLWYYLGIAETALGNAEAAIDAYKSALKYSPSNIEVMQELCSIYEAIGDEANLRKYTNKIAVVEGNIESEKSDK